MAGTIKIVGIGGSVENGSSTLNALKFTLNEIQTLGADTCLFDIKELDLPIFDPSPASISLLCRRPPRG